MLEFNRVDHTVSDVERWSARLEMKPGMTAMTGAVDNGIPYGHYLLDPKDQRLRITYKPIPERANKLPELRAFGARPEEADVLRRVALETAARRSDGGLR